VFVSCCFVLFCLLLCGFGVYCLMFVALTVGFCVCV